MHRPETARGHVRESLVAAGCGLLAGYFVGVGMMGSHAHVKWPALAGLAVGAASSLVASSRRVLLCSDIGKYAQRRLIESGVDIKADVVVVPHHGSLRTMDSKFIEMVWPEYHIVSSGLKHYEGFKKNELDESWYFTAAEGAVNVTVDGGGNLDVSTCR